MRISFIWQGFDGKYGIWQDGLYAALKILEQNHEVRYYDTTRTNEVLEFKPDVVLYWESPVTQRGKDAENWNRVCALPFKKTLMFSGGPLKAIDVKDFDLVFVESQINEDDCEREGIPYRRAFGVNEKLFTPVPGEKLYDGFMHATFAGWKRHELFADALGSKGAVCGRRQPFDDNGYQACVKQGVAIFRELLPEDISKILSQSVSVVNTSDVQGGGQRCTLESMAAGVPVICMSDSPKNREFVLESGAGLVAEPTKESIRSCIEEIRGWSDLKRLDGRDYVLSKWSGQHYADSLLAGFNSIV